MNSNKERITISAFLQITISEVPYNSPGFRGNHWLPSCLALTAPEFDLLINVCARVLVKHSSALGSYAVSPANSYRHLEEHTASIFRSFINVAVIISDIASTILNFWNISYNCIFQWKFWFLSWEIILWPVFKPPYIHDTNTENCQKLSPCTDFSHWTRMLRNIQPRYISSTRFLSLSYSDISIEQNLFVHSEGS